MRALLEQIEELDGNEVYGRVVGVRGLMVEVAGPLHAMSVGSRVVIETQAQGRLVPIPGEGTITGVFTVLVEGDDHNEPIADAVRAILDGHIVMERAIAERGRYPAINVLKSVSRSMPRSADPAYLDVLARARKVMATYSDMEELIRLGAYRPGSSPEVDEAIGLHPALEAFLAQDKAESTSLIEGYQRLAEIVSPPAASPPAGSLPNHRLSAQATEKSASLPLRRRWKPKTNVIAPHSPWLPAVTGAAGGPCHVLAASGE